MNRLTYMNKQGNTALDNDQIRKLAPSVFAEESWSPMSEKYQFIPTINIVEKMRANGLVCVKADQKACRIEGRGDFTKHILRFRMPDTLKWGVKDATPEVCVINSHDGTSRYRINAAIWRKICSNGLIVKCDHMSYSVRHSGDIQSDVLDATYRIMEDVPALEDLVTKFKTVELTLEQQLEYAKMALGLRWDTEAPISPKQLNVARRSIDQGNSLWLTYNRCQENLMQGGIRAVEGRKTRGISSPIRNFSLNGNLWELTQSTADMVGK